MNDKITSTPPRADIVALTVIPAELSALLAVLGIDSSQRETADDGTIYFGGLLHSTLAQRDYQIAVACIGAAGNPGAAAFAANAISRYHPAIVLLAGIAAGIRGKTRIGEVIIAERVVAYEPSAIVATTDGSVLQPRPEIDRTPHAISQAVTAYRPDTERLRQRFLRAGGMFPTPPAGQEEEFRLHVAESITAKVGTIASGEKLLRDPATLSGIRETIHGKTEVGEMEAVGVIEACRRANIGWLIFRGISDFGDEFKNDHFHTYAASAAATVLVDFVEFGLDLGTALASNLVQHWSQHYAAPRSREAREARRLEFESNFTAALKREIDELREVVNELEDQLETQQKDTQFLTLWSNFGYEAARETLDERRRMLEAAAAGLVDPRLSIEDKARVERSLRQLDPLDVRTLYGLSSVVDRRTEQKRHEVWRQSGMSGEVLLAVGCVREDLHAGAFGGAPPDLHLTRLGYLILRVLRSYVQERGAPFDVPGRGSLPDGRSKPEITALLSHTPELMTFLSWASRATRIGKQFLRSEATRPTVVNSGAPPYPYIRFNIFNLERRALCDAVSQKLQGTELSLSMQEDPSWGEPMFVAFLTGPEDVLRVTADFVDAHWIVV